MNTTFWFTAGVLTGVMVTTVSMPLWRGIGTKLATRPRAYLIAAGGIAVFACSAALLYLATGAPASLQQKAPLSDAAARPAAAAGANSSSAKPRSMEEAAAGLEARLEREVGSAGDWELLAKSYEFLGRTADASRARARAGAPSSTASEAEISGTVSIESRLAGRIDPRATLFIYAKAVDTPGPPLAVLRLTTTGWPVSFRLDDSMAMIPSRRLSQFQKVVVEARISRSGQAAPTAGDLYVTSDVLTPSSGKKLALVINHEIG